MFRDLSVMAVVPVHNERGKIDSVLKRIPADCVDETLVVDDGSTDGSNQIALDLGATVVEMGDTLGVGVALRTGFARAVSGGFDVVVVMAGNNKDSPEEIPSLLEHIAEGRADLVQGSRWLGSGDLGEMPGYRKVATRLHPWLFNRVAGTSLTDTTNGFRAIKTQILADDRLELGQPWLDQYELEVYLLYKAAKLGYRVAEVGVTKRYPPKELGQTKMKPITGWWSILRPVVLLGLGLKE